MLTCAACGSENPAGHRFCGSCGAALAATCASCGTPAAPGQRFCGSCGTPLAAAATPEPTPLALLRPAPNVTERRVCSVLFADLVGFTPLSESRDPEEVRELLSRYFDTARTVITRYGGVVEKFIGDAVMAVWGTPVASEGDAERAVRAALDLVAALSALGAEVGAPDLRLRAGVVTGEVAAVLDAVGQGMVAGDAVNTAARVQAAAAPGTVWTDSATQRLASAGVGFRAAGLHTLKGKAEAMELWQATRVLSSVGGIQRVDGLEAPMVGRDAEERALRDLFHAGVERRTPRLVTVTGAAGTGKSRLGWEFEKYIDGLADVVLWHRGRCLSYGDGVAYWALAEAVRQRFGIGAEDAVDEAARKFSEGLEQWLPGADERSFVGVRLGRLLGLAHPDDTDATFAREDLFAGWRLFLERMADVSPVVLLIEDAQHADDGLLDFVEHVVDWARQSPIYVVLLGRSELVERRPGLAAGRNRTSLTFDPLDERSMRGLVDGLVPGMPPAAVDAVVSQAQGNPLFAVETVRSLIDRDVIVPVEGEYRLVADIGELAVPDSLHALLAARLDALAPRLRSLIADASVLGTTFPADALAAVSGQPPDEVARDLAELVRRDVLDVSTDPLSPERGSYAFTQNMLRQVAYDTLSRRDRRVRHLAVAEHLQRVFTAGGDEIMDVVAQHYLDALDALGDQDDMIRRKAEASLVRAGERSQRAGAQRRAARSFARAAQLQDPDSVQAAALWERAGVAFGAAADFADAIETLGRAQRVFDSTGEARAAARTKARMARFVRRRGQLVEARVLLDEALEVLRTDPDADTVEALQEATSVANFLGEPAGRALIDEALGLGQSLGVPTSRMGALFIARGVAASFSGRRYEAIGDYNHAVLLGERCGDLNTVGFALGNLGCVYFAEDFTLAAETLARAAEVARRAGETYILVTASSSLAFAELLRGDWAAARTALDAVDVEHDWLQAVRAGLLALTGDVDTAEACAALPELRESDDIQDIVSVAWVDGILAAAAGRLDVALDRFATEFTQDRAVQWETEHVIWSWLIAARFAFATGRPDTARHLVRVVETTPPGHLPALVKAALPLAQAQLAVLDGVPGDEADALFDDALVKLRAAGSPYHLAHALLDRAEHLVATGRDATALVDEAALIGERLGAVDISQRLGDRVLTSPAG